MIRESPVIEQDRSFLLVRSGAMNCAISSSQVARVVRGLLFHPVPGSQIYFLGLAQYGGEPLPVLDLHILVEGQASGTRHRSTVILGRDRGRTHSRIGLVVDEVLRVIDFTAPFEIEQVNGFVSEAVEFESQSIRILNTNRLLIQEMDASEAADG